MVVCIVFGCSPKYTDLSRVQMPAPKPIGQNTLPIPTLDEIIGSYGFEDFGGGARCIINADSSYIINVKSCTYFSIERGHYTRKNRAIVLYADSVSTFNKEGFVEYTKSAKDKKSKWVLYGFRNDTPALTENIKWHISNKQTTYLYDKNALHKTTETNKNKPNLENNAPCFDKNIKNELGVWVLVDN